MSECTSAEKYAEEERASVGKNIAEEKYTMAAERMADGMYAAAGKHMTVQTCAVGMIACGLAVILVLGGCSAPESGSANSDGTAVESTAENRHGASTESVAENSESSGGENSSAGTPAGQITGTGAAQEGAERADQESLQEDPSGEPVAEAADIPEEAKQLLTEGIAYYGTAGECRMSARQAEAYAEVLGTELAAAEQKHARMEDMDPEVMDGLVPVCGAALIDTGGGLPILFVAGGSAPADTMEGGNQDWERVSSWSIWQYENGEAKLYQRGQEDVFGCVVDQYPALYRDHLLLTVYHGADDCDRNVYRYGGGLIAKEIATSTYLRGFEDGGSTGYLYAVDGVQAEKEAYDAWSAEWAEDPVAQFSFDGDSPKGNFSGVTPAGKLIGVLTEYAEIAGSGV